MDLPREYVRLGLSFDALVPGFVDAYIGDPRLAREVAALGRPEPAELARRARALGREVGNAGLAGQRREFLAGQLRALEASARRLDGDPLGFVDEVEAYFQVRPQLGSTDVYAEAHGALRRLLPGTGELAERYQAYREGIRCPPERLVEVVDAVSSALRERVRAHIGLPVAETVVYEIVSDEPWSGFNHYLGGFRSRVAINADLPVWLSAVPFLVAHESYPGHHTEHCRKEAGLVERAGWPEFTVFLVNTPECLMAEGLADLALDVAVGPAWGGWAEGIYADLGLAFDGALAEEISRAAAPLDRVRQDAALLLHDHGASVDAAVAYLQAWGLQSERRAHQAVRFLTHPLWRAYISTYVEGKRLLGMWLDTRPEQMDTFARFQRLLDEPLTPVGVAAELAESSS